VTVGPPPPTPPPFPTAESGRGDENRPKRVTMLAMRILASFFNSLQRGRGVLVRLALSLMFFLAACSFAVADGGRVCWSGESSGYRLTVFSEPVPLRPGRVDLSVFVQDGETRAPMENVRVKFSVYRVGSSMSPFEAEATRGMASNPLFQAAHFNLSSAGSWQVDVDVTGLPEEIHESFSIEVAPPPAPFWDVAIWIFLPILPIALFVFREFGRPARNH